VGINFHYLIIMLFFFINSPFLFVIGDDRVTYHAEADVNIGEDVDV